MKLVFQFGNEMIVVKIDGKKVYFSNSYMNFERFIPLEPFIEKAHGRAKLKEYKRFLKDNVSMGGMKDYIIKEFESQGFILKKEEITNGV